MSLQLTSHTGADITKIRWTRSETTGRGIAEKITSLNVAGARSEGRVEGPSTERDFTLQSSTPRAYISTYSLRARVKICRGSSKGVSRTPFSPHHPFARYRIRFALRKQCRDSPSGLAKSLGILREDHMR